MSRFWWIVFRAVARVAVALWYRSFRVTGADKVPATGPVLFVVNHPSSVFDAAAVLAAVPRPVSFAAKGALFGIPVLGWALRKLGGIPIHRPQDVPSEETEAGDGVTRGAAGGAPRAAGDGSDTPGARGDGASGDAPAPPKGLRANFASFAKFVDLLRAGGAAAIFPEGVTHLEPRLRAVRSGPARIALDAEEAGGWALGLQIVPVGLQYEPRQRFRGDATVRVGRPFGVADLADTKRHDAIRAVQARIESALRPLVVHLDDVGMEPFVRRIAEIYDEHQIANPSAAKMVPRSEIVRITGECLNHFLVTDPAAIEVARRDLARYERLTARLRVAPQTIEHEDRPVRALLGWLGRVLEIVLGFPVFLAGALVGWVPARATDRIARRITGHARAPDLPHTRLLVGVVCFGVPWAVLAWLVQDWTGAPVVTGVFVAAMFATSLYARRYLLNFRAWMDRIRSLWPVAFRRRALHRASLLRADLLGVVAELARRYEAETGAKLVPPRELRLLARLPLRAAGCVLATFGVLWFLWGFRDAGDVVADAQPPSPWPEFRGDAARERIRGDAAAVAGICDALADLEKRMDAMRAEYAAGTRSHYSPADDVAVDQALLTYLTCRNGLLRIAWFYRDPDAGEPALASQAFLLAYTSGVELAARGMQFVDTYGGEREAVRKINAGDPAWEVPPGTLDRVRGNLADSRVLDALAAATARFEGMRRTGALPKGAPWDALVARAATGAKTVAELSDKLADYKWDRAVRRAVGTVDAQRYAASSVVSTWIGDARIRSRPHTAGLIRPEQLAAFRAKLRPGDILIERRNWYLSNVFLPGFWPHGALFVGGEDGLRELGLLDDPRVVPHLAAFRTPDHDGHLPVILESVSEGVIATSMEESIGGADSVAAFRPLLPPAKVADAVARGIRHRGKPYDFDFDFFSHDKLVCTELVWHAYEGPLHFELVDIMGRRTLPALEFVRKWDRERGTPQAQLEFVAFLDGDENTGTAREGDEEALVATLRRPGVTFLQAHQGAPRAPGRVLAVLTVALGVGLIFLRPRR